MHTCKSRGCRGHWAPAGGRHRGNIAGSSKANFPTLSNVSQAVQHRECQTEYACRIDLAGGTRLGHQRLRKLRDTPGKYMTWCPEGVAETTRRGLGQAKGVQEAGG